MADSPVALPLMERLVAHTRRLGAARDTDADTRAMAIATLAVLLASDTKRLLISGRHASDVYLREVSTSPGGISEERRSLARSPHSPPMWIEFDSPALITGEVDGSTVVSAVFVKAILVGPPSLFERPGVWETVWMMETEPPGLLPDSPAYGMSGHHVKLDTMGWHSIVDAPEGVVFDREPGVYLGAFLASLWLWLQTKSVRIREHGGRRVRGSELRALGGRPRRRYPLPYHHVEFRPEYDGESGALEAGTEHGYRYDVVGHLRVNRHRLADGSYRRRVEWVRPHQRGLKHDLYIPKTTTALKGREASGEIAEYLRSGEAAGDAEEMA